MKETTAQVMISLIFVFSGTTHRSCFQILLLRCHFLSLVVKGLLETWMEAVQSLVR